jgi:polysaccharide biosynthesis/export protein
MRNIFFAVCVLWLACSAAIAQTRSDNIPPLGTRPSVQPSTSPPRQQSSSKDAGVAIPASDHDTAAAIASEDFIIGSEDVLEIKVWREPDLSTRAVVRPDGKIGVTLLGDVQASGLTPTELKQSVAAKMTRFVEQPEVSVVVVEIHSQVVHLIGSVARPGAYTLGGPLTVVELLARAGGLMDIARSEEIAIVRKRGLGIERIPFNYKAYVEGRNLTHNIQLKNGDVIVVR